MRKNFEYVLLQLKVFWLCQSNSEVFWKPPCTAANGWAYSQKKLVINGKIASNSFPLENDNEILFKRRICLQLLQQNSCVLITFILILGAINTSTGVPHSPLPWVQWMACMPLVPFFQIYPSAIKKMNAELFQDNIPKMYLFFFLSPMHNKMWFLLQIIISKLLEASLIICRLVLTVGKCVVISVKVLGYTTTYVPLTVSFEYVCKNRVCLHFFLAIFSFVSSFLETCFNQIKFQVFCPCYNSH